MNVELIRARLTDGFHPFAVVTSSGRKCPVPHPESIFPTRRSVIIADRQGFPVILDPPHVVGLEVLPRSGRSRSKGKSKA